MQEATQTSPTSTPLAPGTPTLSLAPDLMFETASSQKSKEEPASFTFKDSQPPNKWFHFIHYPSLHMPRSWRKRVSKHTIYQHARYCKEAAANGEEELFTDGSSSDDNDYSQPSNQSMQQQQGDDQAVQQQELREEKAKTEKAIKLT